MLGAENQQERLSVLSPDYIIGLVDGEGYFSVTVRVDKSKLYESKRVHMVFGIKLREKDGEILVKVKEYFGCGHITKVIDVRPTFSNCLEYQVRDTKDTRNVIIPFFCTHPLQIESKRKSFERFCTIAQLFEQKVHLRDKGFTRMKHLAHTLHR